MDASRASILVQIASYRDPECKVTIDDLFAKASNPERIIVGLNWQFAAEDNDIPFFHKPYRDRIRLIEVPAAQSQGACWARSMTQSLYQDEDFSFQTDAHMRFVPGWDRVLIETHELLRQQGFEKPVLTHYPPDYYLPGNEVKNVLKKVAPFVAPEGIFVFKRTGHEIDLSAGLPLLTPCLSGGFIFARGDCVREIPYDPHLYFMGEEISLAVRYWTRGWDMFNPGRIIAYHLYKNFRDLESGKIKKNRETSTHIKEHSEADRRNRIAFARVRHLLGTEASNDPEVIRDIESFGLGSQRSIYQYELFSGLRFSDLTQRAFARTGLHFPQKIPLGHEAEHRLFRAAEKAAVERGNGEQTPGALVSRVARLLGLNSIVDLGSALAERGELSRDPPPFTYFCTSIDRARMASLRMDLRSLPHAHVTELNPASEPIPAADMIAVGTLLEGLPDPLIWQVLQGACRSGARFVSAMQSTGNRSLQDGPFFLPPPAFCSADAMGESLAVWETAAIRSLTDAMPERESQVRRQVADVLSDTLLLLAQAFRGQPALFQALLSATIETSGARCKEILASPTVQEILQRDRGQTLEAKDRLMALRWRDRSATAAILPDFREDDATLAMVVTCDFIADQLQSLTDA